jgi:hypothetical protein
MQEQVRAFSVALMESGLPTLPKLSEAAGGGGSRILRIAGLLVVIGVLSSQPTVAVRRHASIPERLRGSWAPSAEACKDEDK